MREAIACDKGRQAQVALTNWPGNPRRCAWRFSIPTFLSRRPLPRTFSYGDKDVMRFYALPWASALGASIP